MTQLGPEVTADLGTKGYCPGCVPKTVARLGNQSHEECPALSGMTIRQTEPEQSK